MATNPLKVMVYVDKIDLADELEEDFHATAKEALNAAADILLADVKRRLSLRPGTLKTAAPAEQSPEIDTGALLRSFRKIPARVKGRVASSGIRSNDPGANRVEYGKTDVRGIRTLPHPFVRPAIAATAPAITALLQERLA